MGQAQRKYRSKQLQIPGRSSAQQGAQMQTWGVHYRCLVGGQAGEVLQELLRDWLLASPAVQDDGPALACHNLSPPRTQHAWSAHYKAGRCMSKAHQRAQR